jgi:hypothetical protein
MSANEPLYYLSGVDEHHSQLLLVVKSNLGFCSHSVDVDPGVVFEVHLEEVGDQRNRRTPVEMGSSVASCQSSQH